MSNKSTFIQKITFVIVAPIAAALFVAISPLLIIVWIAFLIRGLALVLLWRYKYGRQGKVFLAVYSDSEKWREYFQSKILPILGDKAVIVNISSDSTWKAARSSERLAHRHWGGRREHTPIVLFFPRRGRVQKVRLYEAFLTYAKRGDESELLNQIEKLKILVAS